MSYLAIALAIAAVAFFAAVVLLGAWIDGRRQAVRKKGLQPVTTPEGNVEAREYEHGRDSNGERNGTEHHQG